MQQKYWLLTQIDQLPPHSVASSQSPYKRLRRRAELQIVFRTLHKKQPNELGRFLFL